VAVTDPSAQPIDKLSDRAKARAGAAVSACPRNAKRFETFESL
jgi:hypothetical protein